MKPLFVLIGSFGICLLGSKLFQGSFDFALSGKIAMSIMLVFTAIGHFAFNKGMAMMIPKFVPYKTKIVFATGLLEIAAAIGLHIPNLRSTTAWLLILFFLAILPANIYASIKKVDYQNGNYEGKGVNYLWFRIPFQIFLIAWVYFFVGI